jgi:DNA replication protein DnaC
MSELQWEEVENLLKNSKFSKKICPTCGSKGELSGDKYVWDPGNTFHLFGKTYPCDCSTQVLLMKYYMLAHIPDHYWGLNEKDYYGDPVAWKAMEDYLEYWKGARANGIGIEFYSKRQGTGKTMLATYIGKELIKRGERVYFISFRSIMDLYTRPYEVRKIQEDHLHNDLVLILDEIVPPVSQAQQNHFGDKFEELIRDRTNYGKVTILTTNLLPEELDEYYPRTYSLLSANQERVAINGEDVRKGDIGKIGLEMRKTGERRPIS